MPRQLLDALAQQIAVRRYIGTNSCDPLAQVALEPITIPLGRSLLEWRPPDGIIATSLALKPLPRVLYFRQHKNRSIPESLPTVLDIHNHILPGVDDGAASLDVAIAMLDAAFALGVRTIVATPHLTRQLSDAYAATIKAAFDRIEPHARARGIALERGFEIRLSPDLPHRLRTGEPITLAGSRAVLVDLPFVDDWPLYADETLFAIQSSGFQPILAHPERYPHIQQHPELAREIAGRGVTLQVNIASLTGIFGRRAKRAAETLVRSGIVQLVATDAHSAGHRMAATPDGLKRLRELVGEGGVRALTTEHPASLLNDDPLPAPVAGGGKVATFGLLQRVFASLG